MITIDLGRVQVLGNLASDRPDAAKVGSSVVGLGRSHGDEDDLRLGDSPREVGGELEPAVALVAVHQLAQAGLVDRDLAFLQAFDLGRDLVDADDIVPALRQASALNQAHVSRPDHCNFHDAALLLGSVSSLLARIINQPA